MWLLDVIIYSLVDALQMEYESFKNISHLVSRCCEGLSLWKLLCENQFEIVAGGLDQVTKGLICIVIFGYSPDPEITPKTKFFQGICCRRKEGRRGQFKEHHDDIILHHVAASSFNN